MSKKINKELKEIKDRLREYEARPDADHTGRLSDPQYVRLFRRLLEIEGCFPDLVTPASPSQKTWARPSEPLPMVRHRQPMPRLEKALGDQEVIDFDGRIRSRLGKDIPFQYTVEPSMNGISVALVYQRGALVSAATKGDGYLGERVTPNLKTILTIPLTLAGPRDGRPVPDLLEVWGEVYMEIEGFHALNRDRMERNRPPFTDPKAAAAALLHVDLRAAAKWPLNMFCFGVGHMSEPPMDTHDQLMTTLQQWGLRVNRPQIRLCNTIGEVLERCHYLEKTKGQFPYEIDGAVIKVNQLHVRTLLAEHSFPPMGAFTYAFRAPE